MIMIITGEKIGMMIGENTEETIEGKKEEMTGEKKAEKNQ